MANYFAVTDPHDLSRREICTALRTARRLGCWAQVPEEWKELSRRKPDPAPTERSAFWTCLDAKSDEHNIPPVVLREVARRSAIAYKELVRQDGPLVVSASEFAQSRVNSFIRLRELDPGARTDDADLLRLVEDANED